MPARRLAVSSVSDNDATVQSRCESDAAFVNLNPPPFVSYFQNFFSFEEIAMSVFLPTINVGEPIRHGSLSVFPLFCEAPSDVAYQLSDEAIDDESVVVTEVSEQGSVPDLIVENKGDVRVLFLE